ncbi:MAG: (4Fe-4S)-binding protein [Marinilabiliales bacterium]|nr:MAG: (4Fe-4S)-binding protein [Marinilabiliales bacterium]
MRIVVGSGKGGTGKTFLSVNLFSFFEEQGMKVSFADCDVEEPNADLFLKGIEKNAESVYQNLPVIDTEACTFCGKCHEYCAFNAIMFIGDLKYINVSSDLCHDCGACLYSCKFDAISETKKELGKVKVLQSDNGNIIVEGLTNIGVYSGVRVIKSAVKQLENQGVEILDAPPGTSCPFVTTTSYADYVILVTEPTWFGLNDLKLAVDVVKGMKKPFGVVINRAGDGEDPVSEYLREEGIDLLAKIPFDRRIATWYSEGKIPVLESSDLHRTFYSIQQKLGL